MRREPMPEDFRWRTAMTRRGLERADMVIAATRSFAADLRAVYGRSFPIAVVPNGRNSATTSLRKQRLVFAAGRLWDEGKNITLLDRIADRIDAPIIAAGATAGPNGARAQFPHLLLPGSLSEDAIAPWYARAAIFAAPARYEPFGLAVLEAAQAGAALVLADIPTFRELWGDAALFCAPDDADGWAIAMQTLLDTPAGARELGMAARHRAERFSVEAMIASTMRVYADVLPSRDRLPLREAG
jgi:glycosyltransferase involved in cell wall biosynthesis